MMCYTNRHIDTDNSLVEVTPHRTLNFIRPVCKWVFFVLFDIYVYGFNVICIFSTVYRFHFRLLFGLFLYVSKMWGSGRKKWGKMPPP